MSNAALRAHDLLGMPVYSIAEGKHLGAIRTLYVQRADRTVAAAAVGGSIGPPRHIRFADFNRLGDDIALVQSAAVLDRDLPDDEMRGLDSALADRPVLTESGQKVGEVIGFSVNCVNGRIEAYRMRPEAGFLGHVASALKNEVIQVSDQSVVSLGADAVIVRNDVAAKLGLEPKPAA
ncbi:MAG TPA: PRC-barrel domain-containing protein [Armatimonadota bacterium]|nr:PRC-barrel domain-containing protein [Armatimonadota bacterium]